MKARTANNMSSSRPPAAAFLATLLPTTASWPSRWTGPNNLLDKFQGMGLARLGYVHFLLLNPAIIQGISTKHAPYPTSTGIPAAARNWRSNVQVSPGTSSPLGDLAATAHPTAQMA